ncbi:MAG: DNA primase [Candidatus Komeilibacteria bacterium]|nr:DNA primase [Candidatus Komeilibacteria bacterium]
MNNQIETIKERTDIVELVQEYIKLTPAGMGSFKALCPFHNEKSPSFIVSRDKQIWHCFGCGEGGDAFTWVQRIEGVDFPEALRILARKANVQLTYEKPEVNNEKTRLLDICEAAASYWHKLLTEDKAAQPVRDYVKMRGLKAETTTQWRIGWAPDAWDDILGYLKTKGYTEKEIFAAGLSAKKENSSQYYDRFRNRLIFPIGNGHGQVVGFTGRTMGDDKAKYINTPQTLIYNKSNILFGLDKARTAVRRLDYAILVEGNMDVIAVAQSGTANVAGISGTALTPEQIKIIRRYTNNVMISFDNDTAGQRAALRGLDLAWQSGLNVKIIVLKHGKDPDECIKKDPELWRASVKEAIGIIDFIFKVVLSALDLQRSDHKKKAAAELIPVLSRLPDPIERSHYIQKLADILAVQPELLEAKVREGNDKTQRPQKSDESSPKEMVDMVRRLGESMLAALIKKPALISLATDKVMPEELQQFPDLQEVYKQLIIKYNLDNSSDSNSKDSTIVSNLKKNLSSSAAAKLDELELLAEKDYSHLSEHELEHEFFLLVNRILLENHRRCLQDIEIRLRKAEAIGNIAEANKLMEDSNYHNQQINILSK